MLAHRPGTWIPTPREGGDRMTDPIEHPGRCFRVELDGGASVYAEKESPATTGDSVPMVTIKMPAPRAHALAHLMRDWVSAFRRAPDRADKPSTYMLSRGRGQRRGAGTRAAVKHQVRQQCQTSGGTRQVAGRMS